MFSNTQNGCNLLTQFWNASLHNIPHNFIVNTKVGMNQAISHAGH